MTRFATTSVACTRIRRCHANARWATTNEGGPTTGETISSGSMLRDRRRQIVFAPAVSDVAPGDVGRTGRPLDGERVIGAVRLRAGDVYCIGYQILIAAGRDVCLPGDSAFREAHSGFVEGALSSRPP